MDSFYDALYAIPVQYLENIAEKLQKINPDIAKLVDLRYELNNCKLIIYMFDKITDIKFAHRNTIHDMYAQQIFGVLEFEQIRWASIAVLTHIEKSGFVGLRASLADYFPPGHIVRVRFEEQIASRQTVVRRLPLPISNEIRQEFE